MKKINMPVGERSKGKEQKTKGKGTQNKNFSWRETEGKEKQTRRDCRGKQSEEE